MKAGPGDNPGIMNFVLLEGWGGEDPLSANPFFKREVCSPQGVINGVSVHPWGTTSPLGVKFSPEGQSFPLGTNLRCKKWTLWPFRETFFCAKRRHFKTVSFYRSFQNSSISKRFLFFLFPRLPLDTGTKNPAPFRHPVDVFSYFKTVSFYQWFHNSSI
jgi:hypothetical protein